MKLRLLNFEIHALNFENKVEGTQKLEMETSVQYSLSFSPNLPRCRGEAWLTVQNKGEEKVLSLKLDAVGTFELSALPATDEEKRELHIETFDLLYPQLSAQVACFTSLVGMPRFMIARLNITEDDVMIVSTGL